MKQPMRLTVSVPHGKNVLLGDFISVEMMYRIAPPMKLPMPTMNMDFSILGECIWVVLFALFGDILYRYSLLMAIFDSTRKLLIVTLLTRSTLPSLGAIFK